MPTGYKKNNEDHLRQSSSSRELNSAKMSDKSWQLQQRIGLRVPELAVGSWQMMVSSQFT
jgi:hypothetical protein